MYKYVNVLYNIIYISLDTLVIFLYLYDFICPEMWENMGELS